MAWLSGYLYRKPITLTGGSSGAQTYYQLKLAAAFVTDHMQTDFDDLRFTDADGNLIDAWLEVKTDGTSADVWVEFPSTPANTVQQTYYMYYGKADAVNYWDGVATFLQYHDAATANYQDSEIIGPNNIAYENYVKATGTLSDAYLLTGIGVNVPANDEGGDQLRCIQHNPSDETYYASWNDGTQTYFNNAPAITDGEYHRYVITFDGSIATYYRDGTSKGTNSTNLPNEAMGLRFSVKGGAGEQKWSFIRKYAANPPTYEFGSEENAPSGLTILDFERAGMRGVMRGIMRGVI